MPISIFQKKVGLILQACHVSKSILYTNTQRAVKCETPKLGASWIDKNGYKSDVLMIITLQKEQKVYHIRKFTESNAANATILDTYSEEEPDAQILMATSGAANAGINNPEVFGICRSKFLPSMLDVKQEKGRAG
jgi:hypothetical protein